MANDADLLADFVATFGLFRRLDISWHRCCTLRSDEAERCAFPFSATEIRDDYNVWVDWDYSLTARINSLTSCRTFEGSAFLRRLANQVSTSTRTMKRAFALGTPMGLYMSKRLSIDRRLHGLV